MGNDREDMIQFDKSELNELVDAQNEILWKFSRQVDEWANNYANMPVARRPSWIGIILIALAILLDLNIVQFISLKSEGFTQLIFVTGMIALGLGAFLEAALTLVQHRVDKKRREDIEELLKEARKNEDKWFSRIVGR
ncbi:hypothetical protein [Thalassospira povalilytica]|uniref:Uncharacterized protein n=1 Tax=Thalassospira povalilytica TaxID=732237 RepID=A0ABX4R9L2_9PROT|nr:hypothetical protein [Thalassospira povalilytica]PKR50834.1 hypothetical protein CU041_04485 [Thalassospira povalilytica]